MDSFRRRKLRTETEQYVERNVDRFTVVVQGQPRFVGNKNWYDNWVGFYRDTKEQFPGLPLDMFFVMYEYDTLNVEMVDSNKYDVRYTGFPSTEYNYTDENSTHRGRIDKLYNTLLSIDEEDPVYGKRAHGKIPAKKSVFEDYMREVFDFADTVNFCWYDNYELYREIDCARDPELFHPSGHMWQMKDFTMRKVYEDHQDYFDNTVTDRTVVTRTRYDLAHLHYTGDLRHTENLGNYATILQQYVYGSGLAEKVNDSHDKILVNEWINLSPRVVVQQHHGHRLLRGRIHATDYMYVFDKQGFIKLATEFWDWAFSDVDHFVSTSRYLPDISNPEMHRFYTNAETLGMKFFMDKDYTVFSLFQDDLWVPRHEEYKKAEVELYRKIYTEDYDLHRARFYDWDVDTVREWFKLAPYGVADINLYKP